MAAAKHDFVVDQGTTWARVVEYQNADGSVAPLVGYTARMQIRARASSTDPLLTLVPAVNGAAGSVTITISEAQTSALPPGRSVYDLEIVAPNGDVTRLLEGSVLVTDEVTR